MSGNLPYAELVLAHSDRFERYTLTSSILNLAIIHTAILFAFLLHMKTLGGCINLLSLDSGQEGEEVVQPEGLMVSGRVLG